MPLYGGGPMHERIVKILILIVLASGPALSGQEASRQETPPAPVPESIFFRLTLYPTASLSRYDINNDLDLYELRAYAEIRRESQAGEVISDARVEVLSERLDFQTDRFEKRIVVDRDNLPQEISVSIALRGRPSIKRKFPLPGWLVIENPQPAVISSDQDLSVVWRFTGCPGLVNVRVYDFKKGGSIASPDNIAKTEFVVPADKIPAATIVRVYIISSWISKQYLGGPEFVRGSEINLIPWSQVFVRTSGSR
jgi:hypothetical protein